MADSFLEGAIRRRDAVAEARDHPGFVDALIASQSDVSIFIETENRDKAERDALKAECKRLEEEGLDFSEKLAHRRCDIINLKDDNSKLRKVLQSVKQCFEHLPALRSRKAQGQINAMYLDVIQALNNTESSDDSESPSDS